MDPRKPRIEKEQGRESTAAESGADPWDPNGAPLALKRIRAVSVSVADDARESVTYTRPDPRRLRLMRLKNPA